MRTGSPTDRVNHPSAPSPLARVILRRLRWPATSSAQYLDSGIIAQYFRLLNTMVTEEEDGLRTPRTWGLHLHIASASIFPMVCPHG